MPGATTSQENRTVTPQSSIYISLGSVHSFRIHLTDSFLTSELDLYQSGFALELDLYQSRLALELDLYQSRLMGSDPQEGLTHLRCISGGRKPPCDNFHFSPKPADAACPSSAVVRPLLIDQTLTQNKQGTVNKAARKHVHPIQVKSPHTRCTPFLFWYARDKSPTLPTANTRRYTALSSVVSNIYIMTKLFTEG